MPIAEHDPWRLQYFERVACPADVCIPTDDGDAWVWFPKQRWVYDKLAVALSQGLEAGPHGVMPSAFPVFSKPLMNLRGMGTDSGILASEAEYRDQQRPGHFWMHLLTGEHVSTDVAVIDGRALWWRHATGVGGEAGTFDCWTVLAEHRPMLERYGEDWLTRNLGGYTGFVNLESIGGRIIEVHLRFADQWPDLYGGEEWVRAAVSLYAEAQWPFRDANRRDGFSVPLFGPHGFRYRHPPAALQQRVRTTSGISSLQITFHEDWEPGWHAMPPGGFRLAIVNGHDLATCRAALVDLRSWYEETRQPLAD